MEAAQPTLAAHALLWVFPLVLTAGVLVHAWLSSSGSEEES
jgi:hypothetical protein